MSDTTYTLFRDFQTDDHGNYDRMVHERRTPHGVFRAVVERDLYNDHEPTFDAGCPVVRVTDERYRIDTDVTDYGSESAKHDGLPMCVADAIERVYYGPMGYGTGNFGGSSRDDALHVVDRWLRCFHGGSLTDEIDSTIHQGGPTYVAYDTRAMREYWGQTGEMLETSAPDADEWQAWIDGEVFDVSVERACDFDPDTSEPTDWEVTEGPVGGHYGEDHAAEAGIEMLEHEIGFVQRDMLPLEA